ncbi:hypothetical protein BJF78_02295 [Pseudonocardia sp. CNS-139]|nr:hypothetical protein BJF78_02295 [Pseudonocardia sp. CNS-139]
MVDAQDEHVAVRRDTQQARAQQRAAVHVERLVEDGQDPALQGSGTGTGEPFRFEADVGAGPDALHHVGAGPRQGRPQRLVPGHEVVQRGAQRVGVAAADVEDDGDVQR